MQKEDMLRCKGEIEMGMRAVRNEMRRRLQSILGIALALLMAGSLTAYANDEVLDAQTGAEEANDMDPKNPESYIEFEDSDTGKGPESATATAQPRILKAAAARYELRIDVINQVVSAYTKEGKLYRQMICSTGKDETPTPLGTYSTSSQYRWGYFTKFGVWAQYWTRFNGPYLFHSVLYNEKDESTLVKTSLNNLGRRASHGCVRLRVSDAKWIFDNCPSGTQTISFEGVRDSKYTAAVLDKGALEGSALYRGESAQPSGKIVRVTSKTLNLRAKASTSSSVVTVLPSGASLTVISETASWVRVFYRGAVGYVSRDLVEYTGSSTPKPTPSSEVLYTGTVATQGSTLNLRKEPNGAASVLLGIPNQAQVDILEVLEGWLRVSHGGQTGYCAAGYVKYDPNAYDSGVVTTNGGTLNLRETPDASSAVLAELPNGTAIKIAAYEGSWARTSYNGSTGYVSMRYVTGTSKYKG